jgi:hypothetical protein
MLGGLVTQSRMTAHEAEAVCDEPSSEQRPRKTFAPSARHRSVIPELNGKPVAAAERSTRGSFAESRTGYCALLEWSLPTIDVNPLASIKLFVVESRRSRKSFIEARIALLILEREDNRKRRSYNCQYRGRYRQKTPVRDLKEKGDEQRPQNEPAGLPSRPNEKVDDSIPST